MTLYFNKDKAQPDKQQNEAASEAGVKQAQIDEAQGQQDGDHQQQLMEQDRSDQGAQGLTDIESALYKLPRKVLRGVHVSKGVQDAQALDAAANTSGSDPHPNVAGTAADESSDSLVIPLNSSSGQYKPLSQKAALNSDDM